MKPTWHTEKRLISTFVFTSDWMAKWREFVSQSRSVAMQNQSKRETCEGNVKPAQGFDFFEA